MKRVGAIGRFWYDFTIGDDWRIALGVTIAISFLDILTHHGANWWWMLPLVVGGVLATSLIHATRPRDR